MEPRFFDTHCHLDLMLSPDATANESAALGLGLFDCGIDPCDFEAAKKRASRYPNIIAGVGLHPWWLADGRCGPAEVNLLCEVAAQGRYIGEVGLDFSTRFAGSEPLQIQALDRLCDTLVQHPLTGRVISIHAVRSAGAVLDVLESHGLLIPNPDSPVIIFHWFSGTSDELVRARDAGCYFPSTNACSRPSAVANTHDRSHSTAYCSRPIHQPNQTQKQAHSRSSDRSHGPQNASPHSKTVAQSTSSRQFWQIHALFLAFADPCGQKMSNMSTVTEMDTLL